MSFYCGIDFGNSAIKVSANVSGKVQSVFLDNTADNESKTGLKNYIARKVTEKGEVKYLIGSSAIEGFFKNKVSHKSHVFDLIANVKRLMEKEKTVIAFSDGASESAESLAERIFVYLKDKIFMQRAKKYPDHIAVTAPVCYSEIQKIRIRRAAEKAGFSVNAVLPEPVAAIFSSEPFKAFRKDGNSRLCFVLDFGGGTIDCALIRLRRDQNTGRDKVVVEGVGGLHYGGNDITKGIIDKIFIPHLSGVWSEENLNNEAEEAKKTILGFGDEEYDVYFEVDDGGTKEVSFTITYDEVIDVISSDNIVERLTKLMSDVFIDTDYDKEDVTDVQFVGGGSYISYFRDIVENFFDVSLGESNINDEAPLTCVSAGAAVFSQIVAEDNEIDVLEKLNFSVLGEDKRYHSYLTKGSYVGASSLIRPVYAVEDDDGIRAMRFYQVMCDATDPEYQKLRCDSTSNIPPDGIYIGRLVLNGRQWENSSVNFSIRLERDGAFCCDIYDRNGLVDNVKLDMEE